MSVYLLCSISVDRPMVPKDDESGYYLMQRTMEFGVQDVCRILRCLDTHGLLQHSIAGSYDPPQLHAMATHARPNLNYPQTVAFQHPGSTANLLQSDALRSGIESRLPGH